MKPGALGASSYLILNAGACRVCRVGADSVTCDRFQCKAQTQPPYPAWSSRGLSLIHFYLRNDQLRCNSSVELSEPLLN